MSELRMNQSGDQVDNVFSITDLASPPQRELLHFIDATPLKNLILEC